MEYITSRRNPKIKQVRALHQRKYRQEARLFLVEGIHHIGEAVAANAQIEAIYYSPERLKSEFALKLIDAQSEKGLPCIAVSVDIFDDLAEKQNPQGILAVVRQKIWELDELNPERLRWGVALVSPQDPGNLGTILRTIEAVGANGLILLDGGVDLFHPSAVRASMGTIFWLPVAQASFTAFTDWIGQHGYHVYGSSARGEFDYLEARPYKMPRILLLGSEQDGLTSFQQKSCEMVVRLPMNGRVSSLNLSVAAGILLYAMRT